jgi:hypothetical protein
MQNVCKCSRIERIASVDGVDYVRCLDCDRIFEAEDLDAVPVSDDEDEGNG